MLAVSTTPSQSTHSIVHGHVRRPCTLSLPPSDSPSFSPLVLNGRKRRAGTLSRIDLSAVTTFTKEFCGSNESLGDDSTRGGEGHQSPSQSTEESSPSALSASGLCPDSLKRLRLCPTSSTATTIIGLSSSSDSDNESAVSAFSVRQQRTVDKQTPPTLAELEFENGDESNNPKHCHLASGGLVIWDQWDGRFELVGDGRNCKAVDVVSQTVFHCQVMKSDQFRRFLDIVARIQTASAHYSGDEFEQRRDLLLPLRQLRVATNSTRPGFVYVLLPDHFGNLHQLVGEEEEEEEANFGSDRAKDAATRRKERRLQPILKQIVRLVEFCHRIGLFFRDFRLKKFVFADTERTRVRVNNVLDLCLADIPTNDSLVFREFVPAYVAPEILDKKNTAYGARAADIWAFGVLMFALLNGRYPFYEASPSPIALLRRIRAHRLSFPINKSISESARWLLYSLLNQTPTERPTAEELLEAHWFRTDMASSNSETGTIGSKLPMISRPKFCREVPTTFGRFIREQPAPSMHGVLFNSTTSAQHLFQRLQQRQNALIDQQMELTRVNNERIRHLRSLLADPSLLRAMVSNGGGAGDPIQQRGLGRWGLAELIERHKKAASASRRINTDNELHHRHVHVPMSGQTTTRSNNNSSTDSRGQSSSQCHPSQNEHQLQFVPS